MAQNRHSPPRANSPATATHTHCLLLLHPPSSGGPSVWQVIQDVTVAQQIQPGVRQVYSSPKRQFS